jgi:polysaccharide export outer membrane protein
MRSLIVALMIAAAELQTPTRGHSSSAVDCVVGPHDLLQIVVFDERDLTGRYEVGADGAFSFPWIGRVEAGGLSVRDVEGVLQRRLAQGFLINPQVTVSVEQYRSQSIYLMGEVRSPGRVSLQGQMTLLEALAQAGLTTSAAGEVLILRSPEPGATVGPILPNQDSKTELTRVKLKELQSGQIKDPLLLRDGDTVFVPKAELIFVTGQVRTPGSYVYETELTVLQALSLAGGVADRGSSRRVKIVRVVGGRKVEIGVKMDDLVQPGDTIIVLQRFF